MARSTRQEGRSHVSKQTYSWKMPKNPNNLPTVCVTRFGAFGDLAQALSVCTALKKRGHYVALLCSHPSSEIAALNPSVDELIVLMQDTIPVNHLGHMWHWIEH